MDIIEALNKLNNTNPDSKPLNEWDDEEWDEKYTYYDSDWTDSDESAQNLEYSPKECMEVAEEYLDDVCEKIMDKQSSLIRFKGFTLKDYEIKDGEINGHYIEFCINFTVHDEAADEDIVVETAIEPDGYFLDEDEYSLMFEPNNTIERDMKEITDQLNVTIDERVNKEDDFSDEEIMNAIMWERGQVLKGYSKDKLMSVAKDLLPYYKEPKNSEYTSFLVRTWRFAVQDGKA